MNASAIGGMVFVCAFGGALLGMLLNAVLPLVWPSISITRESPLMADFVAKVGFEVVLTASADF